MTAKLNELINELSLLGTTKEASASKNPEDTLVSVLQNLSNSLEKKAEEEGMDAAALESAGKAGDAAEAADAIVKNPEAIASAVASAVSDVIKNEPEPKGEEAAMNDELIQKISSAVAGAVKVAIEGDAAFGVAGDASQGNPAGAGNVQNLAKKILDAKTTKQVVTDPQMVEPGGAVDPMIGVAPTPVAGEQKPLQGNDIKAAMAALSDEDATMFFKLASIGYDVTVETLSDDLVQEKVAEAQAYQQQLQMQKEAQIQQQANAYAYQMQIQKEAQARANAYAFQQAQMHEKAAQQRIAAQYPYNAQANPYQY